MKTSELQHVALGAAIGVGLSAALACVVENRRNRRPKLSRGSSRDLTRSQTWAGPHQAGQVLYAAQAPSDFLAWGSAMLKWIVRYRTGDALSLPVVSRVQPNYLIDALPRACPEEPEHWGAIMADLDKHIVPGLTHWENSARFFGYFKPHASYPAVMGELLCAGLNVMGFDWIASPACTELEMVTLDWLAKLLRLPESFLSKGKGGGVIQGSAGEANIVVMLAAAVRAEQRAKVAGGDTLPRHKMVVYGSDQTHAVCHKACMVLGCVFRPVSTKEADGFGMRGAALSKAVEADVATGLVPIAVCATTGTTSSCAFDSVREIAAVCRAPRKGSGALWLHIDAAYGGAYACLPELTQQFDGLELADSLVVNAHKKLLCPFDLAALYLADRAPVLEALSLQPEYLRNAASASGAVTDFEHLQLPLGRRFRALKLWFVLRRFGASGIRTHVRRGVELRQEFEKLLAADGGARFEVSAPPSLSLVCFRWRWPRSASGAVEDEEACNEAQVKLKEAVNASGESFIIFTKLGDKRVLRLACGGLEQEAADVDQAWEVIQREAVRLEKA